MEYEYNEPSIEYTSSMKEKHKKEQDLHIKTAMALQFQSTNAHVKPVRLIEFQPTA